MTAVPAPPPSPHTDLLGAEIVVFDAGSDTLEMRFNAPPEFATPRGQMQGGLVCGFLDEVMGLAHYHATGGAEAPLMLEISMSLISAVPVGPLVGKARVVRRGRTVSFIEGELFRPDGKLVARATTTALVTKIQDAVSGQI